MRFAFYTRGLTSANAEQWVIRQITYSCAGQ